jgi:hypothetical protein
MGHDPRLEPFPWHPVSRARRLTIGDLMVGVALAALGCGMVAVALRSSSSGGELAAFGVLTLFVFGLYAGQWALASIPARRLRPGIDTLRGVICYALAMATYVGLFILALAFPQGAALVVVTMLVLLVYQTTWD